MLNHEKICIYGYPRSGTKLIASILAKRGYHNYGEWFDTWTSEVYNDTSVRTSSINQELLYQKSITYPNIQLARHLVEQTRRLTELRKFSHEKSVITIWHETFTIFPWLMMHFHENFWLCPTRDPFEQLCSRLVVWYNHNPDGDTESHPVRIEENIFRTQYWKLQSVNTNQKFLVESERGMFVDFKELINGQLPGYTNKIKINTVDQHRDIFEYVINLEEIKNLYIELENIRKDISNLALLEPLFQHKGNHEKNFPTQPME
jgi:hypothetical protein